MGQFGNHARLEIDQQRAWDVLILYITLIKEDILSILIHDTGGSFQRLAATITGRGDPLDGTVARVDLMFITELIPKTSPDLIPRLADGECDNFTWHFIWWEWCRYGSWM